ncbi:MAG: SDR family NAD(P)-dependent oxidoreductase [Caulobacteraceae bacterium]
MTGSLQGQVALVTGAGRGFGKAIAQRLGQEGAAVALVSRSRGQLDAAAAEINASGGKAVALPGDVTSRQDVERVVKEAEAALGPLTLLVNNAGVPGPFGPLWEIDPDQWWAAQGVHIKAPVLFLRAVLPGMIERKGGRIVLVSALAARMAAAYMSAYCTGKIAQSRLAEEVALEAGPHGVRIFAIDPGFVFTGIAEETMNDPAAKKWLPGMVERLTEVSKNTGPSRDLERCAQRCVDLASGRYDGLNGRYLELPDDLDAMLNGARPHWQTQGPPPQPSPEQPATRR